MRNAARARLGATSGALLRTVVLTLGTTLAMTLAMTLGAGLLPAFAAVSTTVTAPADGAVLSGPVTVRVAASHGFNEDVGQVAARLSADGSTTYPGTPEGALTCTANCDSIAVGEEEWTGTLDPARPFGATGPIANGTYLLQARADDGGWSQGVDVVLSVLPSPVRDLGAHAEGYDVSLSWTRAPEPDISGYRVERRRPGATWQRSGVTDAASFQETLNADGDHEYRVVSVRPDGRGGQLTATSSVVTVTTGAEPEPAPSPTSSGSPTTGSGGSGSTGGSTGSGGTADGGTDGGDGGSGSGSQEPPGTTSDADGGTGDPTGGTSTRSSSRRVPPPPGVSRSTRLTVDAQLPDDPQVASRDADERYFGEDGPFSEELDYGAVDPVTGEPRGRARSDGLLGLVPGGVQEFLIARFDQRTLVTSVAAGLLLVTLGLHVFRWMHAPIVEER